MSMSGSFQLPGCACGAALSCLKPMPLMLRQVSVMSPVVRQELPLTEPPQFQTMDGVWEVQLQPLGGARTVYSHLSISQKGDTLSGTWNRSAKEKLPFTGTFDGRLFKLTLSGGQTMTMSGYAENFGDMVGLLTTADPKDKGVPFTASHRKHDKLG